MVSIHNSIVSHELTYYTIFLKEYVDKDVISIIWTYIIFVPHLGDYIDVRSIDGIWRTGEIIDMKSLDNDNSNNNKLLIKYLGWYHFKEWVPIISPDIELPGYKTKSYRISIDGLSNYDIFCVDTISFKDINIGDMIYGVKSVKFDLRYIKLGRVIEKNLRNKSIRIIFIVYETIDWKKYGKWKWRKILKQWKCGNYKCDTVNINRYCCSNCFSFSSY